MRNLIEIDTLTLPKVYSKIDFYLGNSKLKPISNRLLLNHYSIRTYIPETWQSAALKLIMSILRTNLYAEMLCV